MIVIASAALMSWELVAKATHRPTITDLSHRSPFGFLVWAYVGWLACHFVGEAVRAR